MAAAGRQSSTAEKLGSVFALEREAHGVAERLPDLLLDADRIAATVSHGIHGRRRAGPGETFWQFRQYQTNDSAQLIDWRRSASSDHLFVREREWEAAHTMWLWPDLSASMNFRSHLSKSTKRDRGIVLMLAAAELLVRGGERVGLLGVTAPTSSRKATTRIAEAIATQGETAAMRESLPPRATLSRFSSAVLISDFLDPIEAIRERVEHLASGGVSGHLVQVLDPAEETLPYDGRVEFLASEGGVRVTADRVETLRDEYRRRLLAHRDELAGIARRVQWTLHVHHTDRPAASALLALYSSLAGLSGGEIARQGAPTP
ncbi:MAG: DUF58 domain-containing protein [Hyphomicrobiales bacterium]|nr:DUF58 domain-containing protein [Hyphomicrobiales bacterium]